MQNRFCILAQGSEMTLLIEAKKFLLLRNKKKSFIVLSVGQQSWDLSFMKPSILPEK